ncbi:MAG: hypothetical protein P8X83_08135, partial [Nitrosopumilaceae archaeon]
MQVVDTFENQMLDIMNKSATVLMISVGHRTKLFDVMSKLPPSTSTDIAKNSNLNERYVQEWLGALVTAKIIDYDPQTSQYTLSKEKANFLTRNGKFNMATTAQFIPVLAQVEDEIIHCFENGGGVPYEKFHRFHDVMAEESNQTVLVELINGILPVVPGIIESLQKGIRDKTRRQPPQNTCVNHPGGGSHPHQERRHRQAPNLSRPKQKRPRADHPKRSRRS